MQVSYKVENIKVGMLKALDDSAKQEKQLNAAGAEGWKLITVSAGKDYFKYVYSKTEGDTAQYVYKVEIVKTGMISLGGMLDDSAKQEKQLNAAGAEGWKLVTISQGNDDLKYVYIKEV